MQQIPMQNLSGNSVPDVTIPNVYDLQDESDMASGVKSLASVSSDIMSNFNNTEPNAQKKMMDSATEGKKGILGTVAENANLILPAVMAIFGASGIGGKGGRGKAWRARQGFISGIEPGIKAAQQQRERNQQEALGISQEVLNNQELPYEIKTNPQFLTTYVDKRMGDKIWDKSLFSDQVNRQINSFYDITEDTQRKAQQMGENELNLMQKSWTQNRDMPYPSSQGFYSGFSKMGQTDYIKAVNEEIKKMGDGTPEVTLQKNVRSRAPNDNSSVLVGLTDEQKVAAMVVAGKAGYDPRLVNRMIPDDSGEQLKENLAQARIDKLKAKEIVKGKAVGGVNINTALRLAWDMVKENGGKMQDYLDEILDVRNLDVSAVSRADRERGKSYERQMMFFTKRAMDVMKTKAWSPANFEDMKAYQSFKSSLADEEDKGMADAVWDDISKAGEAERRAGIWPKPADVSNAGGSSTSKEEPKNSGEEMTLTNKATGEQVRVIKKKDGYYRKDTGKKIE